MRRPRQLVPERKTLVGDVCADSPRPVRVKDNRLIAIGEHMRRARIGDSARPAEAATFPDWEALASRPRESEASARKSARPSIT